MAAFEQSPLTLTQALLPEAKVQLSRDSATKATLPYPTIPTWKKPRYQNHRKKTTSIRPSKFNGIHRITFLNPLKRIIIKWKGKPAVLVIGIISVINKKHYNSNESYKFRHVQ
jgi:hypothetical protein